MAAVNETLNALLMDVYLLGAVTIDKKKLFWLMGKSHDRPSAWAKLADVWEEMQMERDKLEAVQIEGTNTIVLMSGDRIQVSKIVEWAGE